MLHLSFQQSMMHSQSYQQLDGILLKSAPGYLSLQPTVEHILHSARLPASPADPCPAIHPHPHPAHLAVAGRPPFNPIPLIGPHTSIHHMPPNPAQRHDAHALSARPPRTHCLPATAATVNLSHPIPRSLNTPTLYEHLLSQHSCPLADCQPSQQPHDHTESIPRHLPHSRLLLLHFRSLPSSPSHPLPHFHDTPSQLPSWHRVRSHVHPFPHEPEPTPHEPHHQDEHGPRSRISTSP